MATRGRISYGQNGDEHRQLQMRPHVSKTVTPPAFFANSCSRSSGKVRAGPSMMTLNKTALAAAIVCVAAFANAQESATTFDVASVKRNVSGEPGAALDMSRGQVRATNAPLQVLIRQAFDVMDSQIIGAPSWVADERYDVIAKVPEGIVTADGMRALLRALLAERFRLTTHTETREMPVFSLTRARADGRNGPGLREASFDCVNGAPVFTGGARPATTGEWPMCTVTFKPGLLYVGGYEIREVIRLLTPLVGRTILDETKIQGLVQIRLEYRPAGRGASPPGASTDERPDLFTALEEQTGLKLVSRRAPVEVLVIDTVERPSPD